MAENGNELNMENGIDLNNGVEVVDSNSDVDAVFDVDLNVNTVEVVDLNMEPDAMVDVDLNLNEGDVDINNDNDANPFVMFDLNEDVIDEPINSPAIAVDDVYPVEFQGPDFIKEAIDLFVYDKNTDTINPPNRGMVFKSGEEFASFVYTYAYKVGFEIHIKTSDILKEYTLKGVCKNGHGEKEPRFYMMERIRFACVKEGRKRGKRSQATGCKAVIEGNLKDDGMMYIGPCKLDHNHPIDPSSSKFMACYRIIASYFRRRAKLNDEAGIPITKNYNSLAAECGGFHRMPFNKQDLRNYVVLERRKSRIMGDAASLVKYFEDLKKLDKEFFYEIELDDEGRLLNVFWADGRSRAMFKVFFDAVTFDTTFLSNRYKMPFAPFIGVNHHGSSVILAAALISHEDGESFSWVFQMWLKCMGKPPSVILSDQAQAIKVAVDRVFPGIPHRLCIWHIMRNAGYHLGSCQYWDQIEKELKLCVHDSLNEEEFIEAWLEMVEKYDIGRVQWVKESFAIKERWAPAYWRGTFCAGMSSTQRSEQANRFFKAHVNVDTGLREFLSKFEFSLKSKVEEEKRLNNESLNKPHNINSDILVEAVFGKIYTNDQFSEVKEEVMGLLHTNAVAFDSLGDVNFYNVDEKVVTPKKMKKLKCYTVAVDKTKGDFTCSCKLFEFRGILCKHIIRCIELEGVRFIPEKYILDRWRKDLVREYEHLRVGYYNPKEEQRVLKALEISMRNDYVKSLALVNNETHEIFIKGIKELTKKIELTIGVNNMEQLGLTEDFMRVWGRKRLQTKEQNLRHLTRTAPAEGEGAIKDPVDKRGRGKAPRPRQKNNKGGKKNKRKRPTNEEESEESEDDDVQPVARSPVTRSMQKRNAASQPVRQNEIPSTRNKGKGKLHATQGDEPVNLGAHLSFVTPQHTTQEGPSHGGIRRSNEESIDPYNCSQHLDQIGSQFDEDYYGPHNNYFGPHINSD